MKGTSIIKICILLITLCSSFGAMAQINEPNSSGMGVSAGERASLGSLGVFYFNRFPAGKTFLEARLGFGYKAGFLVGTGVHAKLIAIGERTEILAGLDYAYHFPGKVRETINGSIDDVYDTNELHYAYSTLTFRRKIAKDLAVQLRGGYSFLLSDYSLTPFDGPAVSEEALEDEIEGGPLFELGIIFSIPNR